MGSQCLRYVPNVSAQPEAPGIPEMREGPFPHRLQEAFRTPRNIQITKLNESQYIHFKSTSLPS